MGLQFLNVGAAAAVAGLVDQPPRLGDMLARLFLIVLRQRESGTFQMGIALKEPHFGALSYPHGLVQVTVGKTKMLDHSEESRARQQTAGQIADVARSAEVLYSIVELSPGLAVLVEQQFRSPEREMNQGDVEQRIRTGVPLKKLSSPLAHFCDATLIEEQIAIGISPVRNIGAGNRAGLQPEASRRLRTATALRACAPAWCDACAHLARLAIRRCQTPLRSA